MSKVEHQDPFHEFLESGRSTVRERAMLARVLKESPALNVQATAAMSGSDPAFKRVRLLDDGRPGADAWGHYEAETRTMRFNREDVLDRTLKPDHIDRAIGVFAHELWHAQQHQNDATVAHQFRVQAFERVNTQPDPRDYTDLMRERMTEYRNQEGKAELNGLNAIASAEARRVGGTAVDVEALARRLQAYCPGCVTRDENDRPRLIPGLRFDQKTGTFPMDAQNVEVVARVKFDQKAVVGLDYRHTYAVGMLQDIAYAEANVNKALGRPHTPAAKIDFHALGLDPAILKKQSYAVDSLGMNPLVIQDARHPTDTTRSVIVARDAAQTPDRPRARHQLPPADDSAAALSSHRDLQRIEQVLKADGRWNEKEVGNLAAALWNRYQADPVMKQLDHVVIGEPKKDGRLNVFAIYSPHGHLPPSFHVTMDVERGAQMPRAESLQQVEQLQTQQAQQMQQQTQAPQHHSPSGPRL